MVTSMSMSRTRGRGLLAVVGMALAVVLAGCSDATPAEEVRAGDGGDASSRDGSSGVGTVYPGQPVRGSTIAPPSGADGTTGSDGSVAPGGTAGGSEPGQVEPSPPTQGGTQPPAGEAFPPIKADPGDRRHPWDGHTVGADGRTLAFTYYAGVEPCSVFDSIVAEEGSDAVRVTIYERSGPEGVACIMLAQQKSATVTLDAPLGARRLVDGAV